MPTAPGAMVFKNPLVTVDSVEYANQVSKARLVPDTPIITFTALVPDAIYQEVDSTTWTLELAGLQIWSTGGLAKALNDAAGTEVEVTLQLKAGTGQPTATFTIVPLPVEFGGEQGAYLPIDTTIPVVGKPTFGTSA